jgi:hypothetical protein
LIVVCGAESPLVQLHEQARAQAIGQAANFDAAALTYMMALCENAQRHAKSSATPRALLDATVVRLALAEKMADVTLLLGENQSAAGEKKKVGAHTTPAPPASNAKRSTPPPSVSSPPASVSLAPVDTTDPASVWQALHDRLANQHAWGWIDNVELVCIDAQAAVIAPRPGHREMRGFMNDDRLASVGKQLEPILGRLVRVTIQTPDADSGAASPAPVAGAGESAQVAQRRQAMDMPLVKNVMEVFPDATVLGCCPESSGA